MYCLTGVEGSSKEKSDVSICLKSALNYNTTWFLILRAELFSIDIFNFRLCHVLLDGNVPFFMGVIRA